jgi:hypothetical protein
MGGVQAAIENRANIEIEINEILLLISILCPPLSA